MPRRFVNAIIIGGAMAGLAIGSVELFLRVSPESRPSYAQQRIEAFYTGDENDAGWSVPDDELGFLGRPLRHHTVETSDYSFMVESDSRGFANAEPWPDRADIVFLGDSLLTGGGVGIDKQLTTLVAKRASGRSVVNLGLPGASPLQQLLVFRRFGAQLQPKLVVACLYVASDVDNAKHFDAWQRAGRQWSYEEFRLHHYPETRAKILGADATAAANGRDSEAPAESRFRALARGAVNATAIGTEILYLLEPWRKGVLHDVQWPDGSRAFLSTRFQRRLAHGMGNDYPGIERIFFDPLVELQAAAAATGAGFVVVLIPSKEETFTAPGNDDVLRVVTEVRQRLDALGMPVLDLYPAIAAAARETAPFFAHDIHLNEAGNAAAAAAIASWIDAARLASAP
jgi:hypothetical protein